MEFLPLLPELKLIVIDFMGENKYQLNYKKVLEEYQSNYRFIDYYMCPSKIDTCKMYCYRYLYLYINPVYNQKYIYNQEDIIVSLLPKRYYYSNM